MKTKNIKSYLFALVIPAAIYGLYSFVDKVAWWIEDYTFQRYEECIEARYGLTAPEFYRVYGITIIEVQQMGIKCKLP